MPSPQPDLIEAPVVAAAADPRRPTRRFAMCAGLLLIAFALPLWQLVKYALKTDIQSHILLVPFIAAYLWRLSTRNPNLTRDSNPSIGPSATEPETQNPIPETSSSRNRNPNLALNLPADAQPETQNPKLPTVLGPPSSVLGWLALPSFLSAALGLASLAGYFLLLKSGRATDALTLSTLGFLCLLLSAALLTLGWSVLRSRLFAVTFLVFMIPLPAAFIDFLSVALQRGSAETAEWMLTLTGMPLFRNGMQFQFPGLSIRVAEECSGIRSTLVLFITSLLAAHLFLRTGWKKALLVLAVIPLGLLRNGLRVTAISWLTVNVDSGIIDGPLHHHGGPFFFALSLIPLFAMLWFLRRSDFKNAAPAPRE